MDLRHHFESVCERFEADAKCRPDSSGCPLGELLAHASQTRIQEIRMHIQFLNETMEHGIRCRLRDDQWSQNGYLFLFEKGKSWILDVENRKRMSVEDLKKEPWKEGWPLAEVGGDRYYDATGRVIFSTQTWMS